MKTKTILTLALLVLTVWGTFGATAPVLAAADPLSADETAGLVFMREEEKLAHDVYVTLYQKWGMPVFNNIASSEATHTSAVKVLLDRYGIADPAAGKSVGQFTDPNLQKLYDQLIEQGSRSLGDALKVGAAIEEIDILDLQTRLAQTDKTDIKLVYNNLKNASYNHLRAFVSTLQRQTGEIYSVQYLDETTYTSIVADSSQPGGRRWGRK